jgi:hypothetical protein
MLRNTIQSLGLGLLHGVGFVVIMDGGRTVKMLLEGKPGGWRKK